MVVGRTDDHGVEAGASGAVGGSGDVLDVIQTIVTFEGTLSSGWMKSVTGVLLLVFVLLQRVLTVRRAT